MYKADGTPISNASAFVAKISQYDGGLFTKDGTEIKDPWGFVAKMASGREQRAPAWAPEMYKADGTLIENPEAYVARIQEYTGDLYDKDWREIRDPHRFLAARQASGGGGQASRGQAHVDWDDASGAVIYTSRGEPVRNPAAFVERIDSYGGGLYTKEGQEIRNPKAFVAGLDKRPVGGGASRGKGSGRAMMFKADGTPIWNPSAYVANVRQYEGGLFTANGEEIRNPASFVSGLSKGDVSTAHRGQESEPITMYKADGTPVHNPDAYVAKIENYEGGLYTASGVEIKNPKAFVAKAQGKGAKARVGKGVGGKIGAGEGGGKQQWTPLQT